MKLKNEVNTMNKVVVKKLIKAKVLEFEAMREIVEEVVPQGIKNRMNQVEGEVVNLVKEILWEHLSESRSGAYDCKEDENVPDEEIWDEEESLVNKEGREKELSTEDACKKMATPKDKTISKKKTQKIQVEFN